MTLDERTAELREKRLMLLMARQQRADAIAALTAQQAEGDKQLHAIDGALELARTLKGDAAAHGESV